MKKIGIIAKNVPKAVQAAGKLAAWLAARRKQVFLDRDTARALRTGGYDPAEIPKRVDMVIVLGGDGTILSAARHAAVSNRKVPLFGVNLGSLGFMAEVSLQELYGSLEKALAGKLQTEERMMLSASLVRSGHLVSRYTVLNDVVVNKGELARLVSLDVSVGEDHLTAIRADGLIVATPTGSTAYSLSAGGPIIHPAIHCFVLTPISPHTLSNRPIAIPDTAVVRIRLTSESEGVSLSLDGQRVSPLRRDDVVQVQKAKYRITMIKHPTKDYYEILRTKLKWGE